MELMEVLITAAMVAFIGLIAVILKAEELPKTPYNRENLGEHIKVFVYSVIAVIVAMYALGLGFGTSEGFVALLGVGYLGLSFIQALAARAAKAE
mgnify:CR=1 FL=1